MAYDANSPTAPRKTRASDRRQQALDFRIAGMTFLQIGQQLGISKQAAHSLVVKALEELAARTAESAEHLRRLELERLDSMLRSMYPEAKQGNWLAVDRVLKIMERRARLLGLDAPVKQDVTTGGDKIIFEVVRKDADERTQVQDTPAEAA